MGENKSNESYDVLIVDDSANNVVLLEDLLVELQYNVRTANNGFEAYEKVKEKLPDLILLDIMMPKINGFEFLARIKKDINERIPVIFITAKSGQNDIDKAYEMGAVDYIIKPVNISDVIDKVESVFKNT